MRDEAKQEEMAAAEQVVAEEEGMVEEEGEETKASSSQLQFRAEKSTPVFFSVSNRW